MTALPRRVRTQRRRNRSSRPQQLERQLRVLDVLVAQHGRPLSVASLARRVRSSERTVERDLESLRDARLPLCGRGGAGGGVWLEISRADKALPLDDVGLMGLLLVLDDAGPLPDALSAVRDRLLHLLDDPTLF